MKKERRLVIVANRLPLATKKNGEKFKFQQSPGGLVSGLKTYLEGKHEAFDDYVWVGWPGATFGDEEKEVVKEKLKKFKCHPVFLPEKSMENFYNGFCNSTLWPLFHYFSSYVRYKEEYWNFYNEVNKIFCDALMEILRKDDIVWIQDYHLMLLPKILRGKIQDISIGFFLHIPFPSYEIFCLIPGKWQRDILDGMLGADIIGFHTHGYVQHFLRSIIRVLGYDHEMGKIYGNRIIKADVFPMGIDFNKFNRSIDNIKVKKNFGKIEKVLKNFKIILSIDRLDYTKGIINRLQGYELFLEKNPQWHNKVALVLVLVPSRVVVEHYQAMKRQIDEYIGRINGKFGNIKWTPINYQFTSLPFEMLTSYYAISDVALITPLRDGMNLIAKEYIATRSDEKGVLILSEMAGASKELGEAIIINPNSLEEIADGLKLALEMPVEEQIRRNKIMQDRLRRYDIIKWGDDFISELLSVKEEQKILEMRLLNKNDEGLMINDYVNANKRLIFLDYDGTLVPFADRPEDAIPGDEILEILRKISDDDKNYVIIISGRDRKTLQKLFGNFNVGFIAEHGVHIKEKDGDGEWRQIRKLDTKWKPKILSILQDYVDRVPYSFIEEKDFSVVWHYRKSDVELASQKAKELRDEIINFTANLDVQVLQGSKVIEVRNGGVNKGSAAMQFMNDDYDFVLAIGDDWTDEDLFKILPKDAYTIKVGMFLSYSRFNLHNHLEVVKLLKKL
ncbi:MAG: bifunctional alpha,alpha-trehalose-phosphate synthase (UDP-forming)/trehalose-phosphatase [Candidatus Altiarchaeales archaeon HGW-Altiarchaeales-1]|nr:MAG: bifunctional alpha,alpha-trehalose-phosphate synthase (UDP-forming)/trehalose-phosphatase [Candidatus Altiarchaeales archaeon HGW-Altiarchaeales-1]